MASHKSQGASRKSPVIGMIGILLLPVLMSCQRQEPAVTGQSLTAVEALAGDDVAGYRRATGPRRFSFPADHGPHPGYRNEWWYLTGNLEADDGRRFGYQVTFFKTAIRPDGRQNCGDDNAWCTDHVWMGHAAVTDVANQRHLAAELFSRQQPGLAGAGTTPFKVWLQDWQLFGIGDDFPWELEVLTDEFSLSLSLAPVKKPVLQGDGGLSRKSPEPGNASYYYSMTRIATHGQIHLGGDTFAVDGLSWLDREWSTSALAPDQSGWDWFSLQLDDGSELMYYRLRDLRGGPHASSSGNFTTVMGGQLAIDNDAMTLEPVETWRAPDGTVYDTTWHMRFRDNDWIVRAVLADQLMDVTFRYWEGAVDVLAADSGERLGRGYLEMVR